MIKSINAINVVLDFPYSISMLIRKLHHHPPQKGNHKSVYHYFNRISLV